MRSSGGSSARRRTSSGSSGNLGPVASKARESLETAGASGSGSGSSALDLAELLEKKELSAAEVLVIRQSMVQVCGAYMSMSAGLSVGRSFRVGIGGPFPSRKQSVQSLVKNLRSTISSYTYTPNEGVEPKGTPLDAGLGKNALVVEDQEGRMERHSCARLHHVEELRTCLCRCRPTAEHPKQQNNKYLAYGRANFSFPSQMAEPGYCCARVMYYTNVAYIATTPDETVEIRTKQQQE